MYGLTPPTPSMVIAIWMNRKRLGMRELEAQVLVVLWDDPDGLVPRDVHERLPSHRPLAYTTVNTVLVRLWEKGVLRRRKRGRAYVYWPKESRAGYSARRMNEILETSGDHKEVLASFLEAIDAKDRSQLRRMLQRRARK
jgi:predicted transcriptional regulator